jgi:putative peptidoglycan lipid II flippase
LVLGSGNFTWHDTIQTAQTLGFFSLSLFAQSLIPLLARSFYAFEDTKTPVWISSIGLVINIIGAIFLGRIYGIFGVAIAFSFASILQMIVLLTVLRVKVGYLDDKKLVWSTLKISALSLLTGILGYVVMQVIAPLVDMRTFIGILSQTVATIIIGGGAYIILSLLFRFEEVEIIHKMLAKYLSVFKRNQTAKVTKD